MLFFVLGFLFFCFVCLFDCLVGWLVLILCVCVCVYACVRACVRMSVCVCGGGGRSFFKGRYSSMFKVVLYEHCRSKMLEDLF